MTFPDYQKLKAVWCAEKNKKQKQQLKKEQNKTKTSTY